VKIFVDENIPLRTVQALREMGHDVLDIRGTADEGMEDDAIWRMAQNEGRLLITTDKGFVKHRGERHYGILVICLRQPNRLKIHQRVMQAVAQFPPREWPSLVVVMRDAIQSIWRAST
jgi:predicted nuclease of predicted toxin-antitoxin system